MKSFVLSLLQNAPFEPGGWDGRWIGCKHFAPSFDTSSEEEVLFSLIYKAVNTSNMAVEFVSLKKLILLVKVFLGRRTCDGSPIAGDLERQLGQANLDKEIISQPLRKSKYL